MSSKRKTSGTKEEVKPVLAPKLRFPEFRSAAAWEEKRLGDQGELLSSLTGKTGADFDIGEARFVTYVNVFSNTFVDPNALRFVDVRDGEKQNAVRYGDVFFTVSSETPEEVGMSSVLLDDLENCYLNSFCTLFRFAESCRANPLFVGYLLRQPLVRAYLTKKAQGSTRYNLSKETIRTLLLAIPSPAEQQRIAECLSSVDELIAAQARKVDALRSHKKGLMQQLFPREGETQPRLRFPEFTKADSWKVKKVGDILVETQRRVELLDSDEYRLVTVRRRYGGLVSRGILKGRDILVKSQFEVRTGDFLISKRQIVHNACGLVPPELNGSIVSNEYSILTPKLGHSIEFFSWFAMQPTVSASFMNCSVGIVIEKMLFKLPAWLKQEFPFPTLPEQQRIASCLSSLDALITAETQKLEALKTHKRGLTQQLFPSPEAVEA